MHIVSQFSFSPERILAWLKQLRACGIAQPVKVGMAGPTSVTALLRYARRCGVAASMRGLVSGAAGALVGHVGPDRIVDSLAGAAGPDAAATSPPIIFHSAEPLKPRATRAKRRQDGTAPAMLWLDELKPAPVRAPGKSRRRR